MSKIINGLRDAENRKNGNGNGYHSTIDKAVSKTQKTPSNNKAWFFKVIIFLFVFLLGAINIWQFMIIKGLYSEKDSITSYLNRIERLLGENSNQINTVGSDVKRMNSNLEALNTRIEIETKKISGLQKDNDAQEFAINNLKKSKETLFNRVSVLEANFSRIKEQSSNKSVQ